MKCPCCGKAIESKENAVTPSVVFDGVAYDVAKESPLPLGEATRNVFYKYRDPDVVRPVLVLVSPV